MFKVQSSRLKGIFNSKLKTQNSKLLLVFLVVFLAACTAPVETLIPTAIPCPQPPALIRPHLALQDLQPVAAPSEVLRAYVITVEQLTGYACELETIINGYRR